MRPPFFSLLLVGVLLTLVAGWQKEDYEIFRVRDAIVKDEGSNVTFYGMYFLGVKPSATQDEIGKAHRKKSRLMHPDKAKQSFIASRAKEQNKAKIPGTKKPKVHVNKPPSETEVQKAFKAAEERYAHLGLVVNILKGPSRERYDFFLANGFPVWRGTNYYYTRFRPGLGTVLFGLFLFGGGLVHYGAMYVSWKQKRKFVDKYVRDARRNAWGDDSGIRGIPGLDAAISGKSSEPPSSFAQENGQALLNRREKRAQEKSARKDRKSGKVSKGSGVSTPPESDTEAVGPQGSKKRITAANGKTLIVDSMGQVFLEGENEDGETGQYLLDPEAILQPTYKDTVVFKLPSWAFRSLKARLLGKPVVPEERSEDTSGAEEKEDSVLVEGSTRNVGRRRGKRNGKTG